MKLLLVDDVNFTLQLVKVAVTETATEIMTAGNGLEALQVMRTNRPDMVLMDLFMPEMNGDECCRIIKADPDFKNIPVLMITAVDDPAHRERCIGAGCDDIIKKPFTQEALVEKVLEHHRGAEALG